MSGLPSGKSETTAQRRQRLLVAIQRENERKESLELDELEVQLESLRSENNARERNLKSARKKIKAVMAPEPDEEEEEEERKAPDLGPTQLNFTEAQRVQKPNSRITTIEYNANDFALTDNRIDYIATEIRSLMKNTRLKAQQVQMLWKPSEHPKNPPDPLTLSEAKGELELDKLKSHLYQQIQKIPITSPSVWLLVSVVIIGIRG